MNLMSRLFWTAKGVNWRNLSRRLLQSVRIRTGVLRKRLDTSRFSGEAFAAACNIGLNDQKRLWLDRADKFFPLPSRKQLTSVADQPLWGEKVTDVLTKAMEGEHFFFSHWYGSLGWPPDYNRDPVNSVSWPTGVHWMDWKASQVPPSDIKLVWEASRFSLGYYFARAYLRSGDEKWAAALWTMLDAWIEQNPPELSVAWRCGQEMAFRLMAMLYSATATLTSEAATNERLNALTRLTWQTARHISININQARMQGNNHALSEALALWTTGLLFPEFPESDKWLAYGRKALTDEASWQIYDDGSYVQNSVTYHRVMMDDLLWSIRLGEINDNPLPDRIYDRFARATNWLIEMTDPDTGLAPNYGANDGALVLPLSCCDYRDFRPVLQAANYVLHRKRCLEAGPWDEKMLLLCGAESLQGETAKPDRLASFAAEDGGYYILRGENSWAMTRCHSYRHRPCQADMLHVDLWIAGQNILRDAGSYSYNCPEPWRSYFNSTAAHNTVQIDGQNQMIKGPQFLWFNWTTASHERSCSIDDGRAGCFVGKHEGYSRLPGSPAHKRSIYRIDNLYVIIDEILGVGEHDVALRWRLAPGEWQQQEGLWSADIAGGVAISIRHNSEPIGELVTGQNESVLGGWESLYYGERQPVPLLQASERYELPVKFVTYVGPTEKLHDAIGDDKWLARLLSQFSR